MVRACPKIFFKMLISGDNVETHIYCENDIVYYWNSYNAQTDDFDFCYLVSPKTAKDYENYLKKLEKECPLLMELF